MHIVSGRWRLGLVLALITTVLWGVLPVALKGLLQGMDAATISWFRFTSAGVLLGAWLAARGGLPRLSGLRGVQWALLPLAVLGLVGNYLLYVMGLDRVTPGTAQVVIQLAPMFMLFGGLWFFRERFGRAQWFGFVVLVTGLALFFSPRFQTLIASASRYSLGVFLVFASAVSWTAYALAQKQLLKAMPSQAIMVCIYLGGSLVFLPLATPSQVFQLTAVQFGLLLFSCLNTLVAYGCFAEALAHWEASRVSAVLALGPLITLGTMFLLSWLSPGFLPPEHLGTVELTGAGLVVAGSMLSALLRR